MIVSAVNLAVLCLIASGLLDLVFKKYAALPRSRGMLIFGIGFVWIVMQFALMKYTGDVISIDKTTLIYGLVAGVFLTLSNIMLVECMGHLPISTASTIYRLNTIPLVLIAISFLGEEINLLRALGIACGLITVSLLYQSPQSTVQRTSSYSLFLALIILASVIRALYVVVTKAGVNNGGDSNTMMLMAAAAWCVGGLAYARFREHQIELNARTIKYILTAGMLVFSIVWLLTTALTLGDASIVTPIANMGFAAAFLFSLLFRMESIDSKKISAIGLAILSIFLLTRSV
ncbi:MAG: EamA family transporter [Pseudomonadota bacterium]